MDQREIKGRGLCLQELLSSSFGKLLLSCGWKEWKCKAGRWGRNPTPNNCVSTTVRLESSPLSLCALCMSMDDYLGKPRHLYGRLNCLQKKAPLAFQQHLNCTEITLLYLASFAFWLQQCSMFGKCNFTFLCIFLQSFSQFSFLSALSTVNCNRCDPLRKMIFIHG